ncbi:MAG TPA: phosphatidate cytidylyltransferase [Flavipsychrobacter sp.]|nr:phosphatidate cytidylyltransferase [Flavipsychrobacter sp.]
MALDLPTFFTRLGSAIIFSIIMMVGLLWNEWAFLALASAIMALCLREFFKLIHKIYNPEHKNGWIMWSVLSISMGLLASVFIFLFRPVDEVWGKGLLAASVVMLTISLLKTLLQRNEVLSLSSLHFFSLGYITVSILMFVYLRYLSLCIPLALILMIWMNDTMAYLVGSFIGKTPFSKISPKKTWEGTAGGAILTLAGAAVWGYFSPYYQMVDWMMLALCASVAGTAGDLFESKLKRIAEVKDSGTMMPGHGGALDRFDSLLISTPFAFAYASIFMTPVPVVIF